MDLNQVTIETVRLRLVPITPKYAEQVFLEYRDPVVQYMNYGPAENLEVLTERIKEREVDMASGLQLFMVVLLKETDEFLGCFVLEDLDQKNIEMGGWLKGSSHGHHYGQEATAALKDWADKNIHYEHILWPCAEVNAPSRKLAESLGGKVQREYEKTTARGTVLPFVDYWILKNNEKKVIILNGWTQGDISDIPEFLPDSPANWMGWTKVELEKFGYTVTNPFLKDAYKQEYSEWKEQLERLPIAENTILVGWSAGGAFWVRWLGETKQSVRKLILVAPAKLYTKSGEESNFDRFMDFTIDPSIRGRVKSIVIFISNDFDNLVESAHLYKKELNAELRYIPEEGHFTNAHRSSPAFPELVEEIVKE